MNLLGKLVVFLVIVYSLNGIVESFPQRGGGGRGGSSSGGVGKSNSSTGGKRTGYYLHGGLYPVSRSAKQEAPPLKSPVNKGIGAWGIIGIILGVLALCCGFYYALYLCDFYQRSNSYTSNLAAQSPHLLMTDKPKPEENGNGNIPMTDKNELAKSSMKSGTNSEVFL